MKNKFCPHCGKKIPIDSASVSINFCPACGNAMNKISSTKTKPVVTKTSENNEDFVEFEIDITGDDLAEIEEEGNLKQTFAQIMEKQDKFPGRSPDRAAEFNRRIPE